MAGHDTGTPTKADPKLVGETSEVQIEVNGIATTGLCDTGSCVSTCSETFYKENCSNLELESLENILKIECADCNHLPYKGYFEVSIKPRGIPRSHEQACLLLVVPDTNYNTQTPVLLGTNVLQELLNICKAKNGEKFEQTTDLHELWFLAFRCMLVRKRELKKTHNKLAILRSF